MSDRAAKIAIVTGGNSGIGKEAAIGIARQGAHVVIAARNPAKAAAAIAEIESRADARGRVETIPIDLASFASVREFAAAFTAKYDRLDILLNNAGLVLRKRLTITGSTLRPRSLEFKTAIAKALKEIVWPMVASGAIKPVIHSTFAAADAAKAHVLMESNQHVGKIVLTW